MMSELVNQGMLRFRIGDFVILTDDFMTAFTIPTLIAPKGTKGRIVNGRSGNGSWRVSLVCTDDGIIEYSSRWVEENIMARFDPDDFDRAWLMHDYAAARALFDKKIQEGGE